MLRRTKEWDRDIRSRRRGTRKKSYAVPVGVRLESKSTRGGNAMGSVHPKCYENEAWVRDRGRGGDGEERMPVQGLKPADESSSQQFPLLLEQWLVFRSCPISDIQSGCCHTRRVCISSEWTVSFRTSSRTFSYSHVECISCREQTQNLGRGVVRAQEADARKVEAAN